MTDWMQILLSVAVIGNAFMLFNTGVIGKKVFLWALIAISVSNAVISTVKYLAE